MIFGIDFDNTLSRNPEMFFEIIDVLKRHGNEVVLVTARSEDGMMDLEVKRIINNRIPIVFAGRMWKDQAALQHGYKIDIWIDDKPEFISKPSHDLFSYIAYNL